MLTNEYITEFRMESILAIDVGTQSMKASIIDPDLIESLWVEFPAACCGKIDKNL